MSPHLQVVAALVGYYLFSCAAGAMLPPLPGAERTVYGYFFRFIQQVAANAHRLADAKLSGLVAQIAAAEEKLIDHMRPPAAPTPFTFEDIP